LIPVSFFGATALLFLSGTDLFGLSDFSASSKVLFLVCRAVVLPGLGGGVGGGGAP